VINPYAPFKASAREFVWILPEPDPVFAGREIYHVFHMDDLLGSWPEKPTTTGPLPEGGGYRVTLPDGREVETRAVSWCMSEVCFCPGRFRGEHLADCRRGEKTEVCAPPRQTAPKKAKKPVPGRVTRVRSEAVGEDQPALMLEER
jgi:hypothetical protein